jgi:hypothetical protein
MAEKKKRSIIEEALWEAKTVEDALKANTKEILASTMKQEIDKVVKESLNEQDEEIEDTEEVEGLDDEGTDELPELNDEEPVEVGSEEGELEMDDLGDTEDAKGELDINIDAEAGEEDFEGDLELDLPAELGDEEDAEGMELDVDLDLGDEEGLPDEIDMTNASDEEVLTVFKKMSADDEIEVVKDPAGGISISDNQTGAEYYIKESDDVETEACVECEGAMYEEEESDDEVVYEIELDEEMYDKYMGEQDEEEEETIDEDKTLQRKHGQRYSGAKVGMKESRKSRKPIKESKSDKKVVTKVSPNILKEYKELKSKNEEYKEALKIFKNKINEVALFNQNLASVTRLFTEHSTTKKEKMAILKRFDSVETIKESKSLYSTIDGELSEKAPITESVDKKVNKTVESSKSNLNESTAYVDPKINKVLSLMDRIK